MQTNEPQPDELRAVPSHSHHCPKCGRKYPGYREARKCREPEQSICGFCLAKNFSQPDLTAPHKMS